MCSERYVIVALAYVIVGTFVGMVGGFVATVFGASLWTAFFLYTLIGAVSILVLAVVRSAHGVEADQNLSNAPDVCDVAYGRPHRLPAKAPTAPHADNGMMKILAVDDDAFILELIPKIASMVGCPNVTTASSSAAALDMLETSPNLFDCLLLDINMPDMDGIDLCGRVRSMPGYRDTPIIMLTAMTDIEHLDRAFKAGATDYTAKPFDIIQFGERLQAAQDRISAQRANAAITSNADEFASGRQIIDVWADARVDQIADLHAMIDYAALQNYLTSLSGSAVTDAYVMGVVVERDVTIAEEDISGSVLLMQVATSINEAFANTRYTIAYAGHGQFVLMANAGRLPDARTIEAAIEVGLAGQARANEARISTRISVGMAVRPGSRRATRAKIAFESAINLAMERAAGKTASIRFDQLRTSNQ